jgi:hypothetical protein
MEVEGLKETSRINKELKKDIEDATEVVLPSENVPDRSAISRKRRLVQKLNGELKAVYDVKEDDWSINALEETSEHEMTNKQVMDILETLYSRYYKSTENDTTWDNWKAMK